MRSTQGDGIVFYIPEDCPVCCGLPRRSTKQPMVTVKTMADDFPDMWAALGGEKWKPRKARKEIRYGCPHSVSLEGLQRKRRLQRYNRYKEDIRTLAAEAGFEIPVSGWALYFYMPMPKRWTAKTRSIMNGQLHMIKPDQKNMLTAIEDALSLHDERLAQMSGLGKFWVDTLKIVNGEKVYGPGWIEILINQKIYNPFSVIFIDQDALKLEPKRKWQKRTQEPPKKRGRKPKLQPETIK